MASELGARLPYEFARRFGVVLLPEAGGSAKAAHRPDAPLAALAEVRRVCARPLLFEAVEQERFEDLLGEVYEHRELRSVADGGLDAGALDLDSMAQQLQRRVDLLEEVDESSVVGLLNGLLTKALREGASDIHIEPQSSGLVVRLRVDGTLREVLRAPRQVAPPLVSRVKVMARLDITEKRQPQDGRMSAVLAGRSVDVRVATVPSGSGERVVLRLLRDETLSLGLDRLGMDPVQLGRVESLIRRPSGIVLLTGPTGSGKTTTLYAMLATLNDGSRNIMTVEDPIEYHMDGLGQTQTDAKLNLDFAAGLRAILRQDPDVVMVGEVRDAETARIALQASQTGHLVLSTLHTNSALGAVTRLIDLGVAPYLLAAGLAGTIAQRLVRELCQRCKRPYPASPEECARLGAEAPLTLYAAEGCPACGQSGFRGRTGVFEIIAFDESMRALIARGASEGELAGRASATARSLLAHGGDLVAAGRIPLAELERALGEEHGRVSVLGAR